MILEVHPEQWTTTGSLQYWKPPAPFNVGDTLPFYHDGTFHFAYLVDKDHHGALGGLGGHQWAQATSRDLVHWTHRPLTIALTAEHEASICTGSVFWWDGVYHGFYATRRRGDRSEHASLAISADGVVFTKTEPNPFLSPGPGLRNGFRDPHVFRDERSGLFHLIVSTMLADGNRGCLAHYTSADLRAWQPAAPFHVEGGEVPECPDTFRMGDWCYLLFSFGGVARYRYAKDPLGPWLTPEQDILDGSAARVMKTAAFTGGRRIGTTGVWPHGYAGYAVFREIVQRADGTLGTRFVPEMVPPRGEPLAMPSELPEGTALTGLPARYHLRATATAPLALRLGDNELRFDPAGRRLSLTDGPTIEHLALLEVPFALEVIVHDRIVDVACGPDRTMVGWLRADPAGRLTVTAGSLAGVSSHCLVP